MEIVVNIGYGGENLAQQTVAPQIRQLRKRLKENFEHYIQKGLTKIKIYLFFNGDLTDYYQETGLYQPTYYNKKEEYKLNICFGTDLWKEDQNENLRVFLSTFRINFTESISLLDVKLKKIKVEFNKDELIELFDDTLNSCLE